MSFTVCQADYLHVYIFPYTVCQADYLHVNSTYSLYVRQIIYMSTLHIPFDAVCQADYLHVNSTYSL